LICCEREIGLNVYDVSACFYPSLPKVGRASDRIGQVRNGEIIVKKVEELPSGAGEVARAYPAVWEAYAALGKATAEAGSLDARTRRLVKLALSIGASSEGAVHSHTRRAIAEGVSQVELKQVALLAIATLGLPQAVKGLTWIEDITDPS
jgi:alkylhydroperoxidase/carboxymuconolactone decarboxylase family protein YurZ